MANSVLIPTINKSGKMLFGTCSEISLMEKPPIPPELASAECQRFYIKLLASFKEQFGIKT